MERDLIHKGYIIKVLNERDGEHDYDIIEHPGAVAMVPVLESGDIVLVKQWRRAVRKEMIELPAGTIDSHENPLECAQRELQEEIGYRSDDLKPLIDFFTAPSFSTERLYVYLAQKLTPSKLPHDPTEEIEVITSPLSQCLDWINQGQINDVKTIAGIFRYKSWIDS